MEPPVVWAICLLYWGCGFYGGGCGFESSGFFNLAAEGGLSIFFFYGGFDSCSYAAPPPKTLFTKLSDDFPEVAHLWINCNN